MIGLVLRTIGTEVHRENFKEGSIPASLVGTITAYRILRTRFLKGEKDVKPHILKKVNLEI